MNIAKDVHDDYTSENNVYLPADWLDDAGVPTARWRPRHDDRTCPWSSRSPTERSLLDDAQTYLETVPLREGNTLAAWAIPFLLAVGTLRELVANPARRDGRGRQNLPQEVQLRDTATAPH